MQCDDNKTMAAHLVNRGIGSNLDSIRVNQNNDKYIKQEN